ncbi:CamS family sex pheromone protein [Alkalihalobacillus sp. AL-G]|uniref:CamS family sex pheromone protein n=1 Tax=Alkalihalobacillus sp. AL-G TaxID=2926399 RepID=UPI00272A5102|nr:CamS family sex pheromone protein [Alkalihalobacillus sp. AL-G]WLD93747.1 CamS family sex pheromone protein [Alkalihalobacillus sp. AL-G]
MYKKLLAIVCSSLILLSGCLPLDNLKRNEVEKEDSSENKNEKAIPIPNVNSQEDYYKSLKNYEPGVARGEISYGVDNRIDVDEVVTGLMRLSKDTFSIDDYYFQEGQYIQKDTIRNWLGRSSEKDGESSSAFLQKGLNPAINEKAYKNADVDKRKEMLKNNPKMLSYIVEQNYLKDSGDNSVKLGGISIALSFNSTYYYTVTDKQGLLHRGEKNLDNSKVKEFAYKTGQEVVNRLRQHPELQDVPIVVGLFMEEEHGAVVPGNYFATSVVKAGQTSVDWEKVNEDYYFFPSDRAEEDHREDHAVFTQFQAEITEYFPNYIGVIGKALYRNDKIAKMTIEIPMQFKGKAEVISFTQYVNYLVKQYYPDETVEVNIKSSIDKIESLIISDPTKEDSMVHIY